MSTIQFGTRFIPTIDSTDIFEARLIQILMLYEKAIIVQDKSTEYSICTVHLFNDVY